MDSFVGAGEGAYVGINAGLRNKISIGANTFIGMGYAVTKSVAPDDIVVGNPAHLFYKTLNNSKT